MSLIPLYSLLSGTTHWAMVNGRAGGTHKADFDIFDKITGTFQIVWQVINDQWHRSYTQNEAYIFTILIQKFAKTNISQGLLKL